MARLKYKTLLLILFCSTGVLFFVQKAFNQDVNVFLFPFLFIIPGLLLLSFKFSQWSLIKVVLFSLIISPVLIGAVFYFYGYIFRWPFSGFIPTYLALILIWSLIAFTARYEGEIRVYSNRDAIILISGLFFVSPVIYLRQYPRVQLSYDGHIFISLAYQIKNNLIPPDNPDLFSVPAGTYWLYSAYLAIVSESLNVSPLSVSGWLAPAVMLSAFMLGIYILRDFFKSIGYQILGSIFVIAGPGLQNSLKFAYLYVFKKEMLSQLESEPNLIMKLTSVFPGIDYRLNDLFHKFLGDGFRFGLIFFMLVFLSLNKILVQKNKKYLCLLSVGIFGLIIFHPVSLIPLVIIVPVTLLLATGFKIRNLDPDTVLMPLVGFLLPIVVMAPYLIDILVSSVWPQTKFDFQPTLLLGFLLTYSLWIPFIIIGLRNLRDSQKKLPLTLLVVYLAGLMLSGAVLFLPDGNQYKFAFLASFVLAVISIVGLKSTKPFILFFAALSLLQYAMFFYIYSHSKWVADKHPGEKSSIERGYRYIRDHTEKSAIIISIPPQKSIGVFTQRRSFADLSSNPLIWQYPVYLSRLRLLQAFSKKNVNPEPLVKRLASETAGETAYLILLDLDNPRFQELSNQMSGAEDLTNIYSNNRLALYRFAGNQSESKNILYDHQNRK